MGRAQPPSEGAITITSYAELDAFIAGFATGKINLLLVIGEGGLQKSRGVLAALPHACRVEGQNTAWGLYQTLWQNRGEFVVIDDVDEVYRDKGCVRLLKQLCQTESQKTLTWNTDSATGDPPKQFNTTSRVILLANEWQTLNKNVRALQDRGLTLIFEPSPIDIHRRTADWFWDQEIFDWIGEHLNLIPHHSMRHYVRALQLKEIGMNWRSLMLRQWVDGKDGAVLELMNDTSFNNEEARARAFEVRGLGSRSTYFERKKRLSAPPDKVERIKLKNTEPSKPGDPGYDFLKDFRDRGGRLGNG